jgi:hypothetical protein
MLLSVLYMQLDMKLDTTYKLPRMRYKGAAGPQPQPVRAAPKQLITEVCVTRHASFSVQCRPRLLNCVPGMRCAQVSAACSSSLLRSVHLQHSNVRCPASAGSIQMASAVTRSGESSQCSTVCCDPCNRWLTKDLQVHLPLRCAWTSQRPARAVVVATEAARQLWRLHSHSSSHPCGSPHRPRSRHSSSTSSQPPLQLCHQVLLWCGMVMLLAQPRRHL